MQTGHQAPASRKARVDSLQVSKRRGCDDAAKKRKPAPIHRDKPQGSDTRGRRAGRPDETVLRSDYVYPHGCRCEDRNIWGQRLENREQNQRIVIQTRFVAAQSSASSETGETQTDEDQSRLWRRMDAGSRDANCPIRYLIWRAFIDKGRVLWVFIDEHEAERCGRSGIRPKLLSCCG